jgi:hypothetical protein
MVLEETYISTSWILGSNSQNFKIGPKIIKLKKFVGGTFVISQTFNENNLGKNVCCVLFVQCVFSNKFSPLLQI